MERSGGLLLGRLKINVDGSFRAVEECGGAGVVVRDHAGEVIAVVSKHLSHVQSMLQCEAEAMRVGLSLAAQCDWPEVEVESDSSVIVAALSQAGNSITEVHQIIEDCRALQLRLGHCRIGHVHREANSVADRLATCASRNHEIGPIFHEVPVLIQDLIEDSCNLN